MKHINMNRIYKVVMTFINDYDVLLILMLLYGVVDFTPVNLVYFSCKLNAAAAALSVNPSCCCPPLPALFTRPDF